MEITRLGRWLMRKHDMEKGSLQNWKGTEACAKRVKSVSTIWRCLHLFVPFCLVCEDKTHDGKRQYPQRTYSAYDISHPTQFEHV
jgi:hypothetical protein